MPEREDRAPTHGAGAPAANAAPAEAGARARRARRDAFGGPRLVAASAVAMFAATAASFALYGATEEALRVVVRVSARVGVVLFALAFAARPLRQLWATPATAWSLRNRRYLGLGFAVAHFSHLAALAGIALAFPDPFVAQLDPVTLVGGGVAYLLLALMVLTSTDRTAAWLSRASWRRLHLTGSWVLWVIFLNSYASRVIAGQAGYAPLVAVLVAAVGVRIAARVARAPGRERGAAPAA
ncbi:MAG: hypothetical protein R3E88_11365 [Myxococcota bacterium]